MKKLLPILAASVMLLAACGGGGAKKELNSLTISNKDELTAQWVVGQDDREVHIECSAIAVVDEMGPGGHLKLTSSDTSVFTVMGSMIHAVAEGEATLSAVYKNYTYDTVTISVTGELPEPAHFTGTIAEAIADLNENNVGSKLYDLEGYIVSWQSGKTDAGEYGNYYLADSIEETDLTKCAYIYGSNPDNVLPEWNGAKYETMTTTKGFDKNDLTKDVGIGSKITMTAVGAYYGTTQEFLGKTTAVDNSTIIHHDYPEPELVTGKTILEFTQDTAGNGKQLYELTGTVTKWKDNNATDGTQYGNFYLADDSGEVYVYGATATATALTWSADAGQYGFKNPKDFLTNELTSQIIIGSEVTIKLSRCDYNGTIEGNGIVTNVQNSGPAPTYPEPAVAESTLAGFIADTQGNGKQAFHFSAEVKSFKNGATTNDKYGNLVLTDGANDLVVYGSTATATALTWSETSGAYAFQNPQDFKTNETTNAIAIGDTVEVKFIRADYQGTVQGTGIILSVTPGEGGGVVPPGPGPVDGDTLHVDTTIGNWSVTGADTSSEKATLTSGAFTLTYEIGTGSTYISSYSSTATNAIRVYAHSNFKIEWDATVASVSSITFTTYSKHFATGFAFVGGTIDSSYTSAGSSCKVNVTGDYLAIQDAAAQVRVEAIDIVYTAVAA